jgi:hypothetical protein
VVAGAQVIVRRVGSRYSWPTSDLAYDLSTFGHGARAVSSPDGSYTANGLDPSGEYEVMASARGYGRLPYTDPPVVAAGTSSVDLVIRRGSRVTLSVELEGTSSGLEDLIVVGTSSAKYCELERERMSAAGASSENGVLRFALVVYRLSGTIPAGQGPSFALSVRAPGYLPETITVDVPEAGDLEFSVRLRRSPQVTGFAPVQFVARLPSGGPLIGTVSLKLFQEGSAPLQFAATFDSDGRTGALALPMGTYTLGFMRGVSSSTLFMQFGRTSQRFEVTAEEQVVEIQVSGSRVDLRVLDEQEQVVRAFDLSVRASDAMDTLGLLEEWDMLDDGNQTDSPFLYLAPGNWVVRAEVPGRGAGEVTVTVDRTGSLHVVDVHLVRGKERDMKLLRARLRSEYLKGQGRDR